MNDFRNKPVAEVVWFNFKLLQRNRGLLRGQASTPNPLVLLCPLLYYCFCYYTLPPYMKIFGSVGHQFGKYAPAPPPPPQTTTTTTKKGGGGVGGEERPTSLVPDIFGNMVWFQTYLGIWFGSRHIWEYGLVPDIFRNMVWFQTYLGIWFAGVCIFPEV